MRRRGAAACASLPGLLLIGCGAVSTLSQRGGSPFGGGTGSRTPVDTLNNARNARVEEIAAVSALTGNGGSEVGLLFAHNPDGSVRDSCTGTLIRSTAHDAHNVVMTAKHCTGIDTFYLGNGQPLVYPNDHNWQDATVAMTAYTVVDTIELDSGEVASAVCPHAAVDIRLLRLAEDASSVTPATIATQTAATGSICRFVGFGVHTDPATGSVVQMIKRALSIPISGLAISTYQQTDVSGGAPGIGDSGGPLYCGGLVAATDSCGSGTVVYKQLNQSFARVDEKAAMIDSIIQQWANPKTTALVE